MNMARVYAGRGAYNRARRVLVFGPGTGLEGSYALALRVESEDGEMASEVCFSPEQVDDLIAQLCAMRGIDSPVRPTKTREVTQRVPVTRPRVIRMESTELGRIGSYDVCFWLHEGGVRGWNEHPSMPFTDHIRDNGAGWDAGPCSKQYFVKHPAYLRALASLHEDPTEVVMEERTVRVEVVAEGVSGTDFTANGGC